MSSSPSPCPTSQTTSATASKLATHVASQSHLDGPTMSARRLNDYIVEPASQGNVYMDVPNGTGDEAARREAHRLRVAEELRKIEGECVLNK